jgi:hypothetical protein
LIFKFNNLVKSKYIMFLKSYWRVHNTVGRLVIFIVVDHKNNNSPLDEVIGHIVILGVVTKDV